MPGLQTVVHTPHASCAAKSMQKWAYITSSQAPVLRRLLGVEQVPYRLLKAFHKVQQRLVRELEKKFSGKDVVLIANRRIMRAGTSGRSNDRPRSRTLTAVRPSLEELFPKGRVLNRSGGTCNGSRTRVACTCWRQ